MDTIFALSTPAGRGALCVVRVSGPGALGALTSMVSVEPKPRVAQHVRIVDPKSGALIDHGLTLYFEEGRSFTGETCVEFQLHGGPAVRDALLLSLSRMEGLRPAEPGEFTRRALLNNRIDILQAEAIGDIVSADTQEQLQQANALMSGKLSSRVEGWRAAIVRAAALLEATIDFADEEVPTDVYPEVREILSRLADEFDEELAGYGAAERIREGFEVALIGEPNTGKSSLLNALAGRDAAITSEFAGTTRDVIEVRMDVAGLPVTFLDTAGFRETDDFVEAIGVDLAIKRATAADMRIMLSDTSQEDEPSFDGVVLVDGDIRVRSKCDLGRSETLLNISSTTMEGVKELLSQIAVELEGRARLAGSVSHLRQKSSLEMALVDVRQTLDLLDDAGSDAEILSAHLRSGMKALDSIVGRIDVEDLLGEIFSSFCIGK